MIAIAPEATIFASFGLTTGLDAAFAALGVVVALWSIAASFGSVLLADRSERLALRKIFCSLNEQIADLSDRSEQLVPSKGEQL